MVIARGDFGEQVAALLGQLATGSRDSPAAHAFVSGIKAVVVALHREDRRLLLACDQCAFDTRIPFLPVVLEPGWLRCGPLIDPRRRGPCYRCYAIRLHQRGADDEISERLYRDEGALAQAADGFLTVHAKLAALVAARIIGGDQRGQSRFAGRVWRFSLDRLDAEFGTLLGVAGCGRCAEHDEQRHDRFLQEVRVVLKHSDVPASTPALAAHDGAGLSHRALA